MKTAVLLVLLSGAFAGACFQEDQFCTPSTSDDLRRIAQSGGGTQCDSIMVRNTELDSLEGAEGIDDTTTMYVGSNANLADVSSLGDLDVQVLDIALNPLLAEVRLGPVGGGTIGIGNNAATRVYVMVTNEVDLRISEPTLETLEVTGDAAALSVDVLEQLPGEARIDVAGFARLRLIGAQGASNVQDVIRLGVPSDFVGLYGTALGGDQEKVDEYFASLAAAGFRGELEVCPDSCIALASCADQAEMEARAGCITYGEGDG